MSGSVPALNLTNAERQAFAHLYAMADPRYTGMISGDAAVKFFEGFQLPTLTLGQIWSIADSGNNGFLTPQTFGVALRLIAHAQRGEGVNEAAASVPGAPPTYQGVVLPTSDAAAPTEPVISREDKARFSRIFAMVGPSNGLLSGEQAKEVFLKSKLPYTKLGEIWNLADTKQRGALDLTDFIIGMHYIQGTMNGNITTLPTTLPPAVLEAALGDTAPMTPLQPQRTGIDPIAAAMAPAIPSAAPMAPPSATSSATPSLSDVRVPSRQASLQTPIPTGGIQPAERAKYDGFFDSLDTERVGHVDGNVVVPFFLQSGLDDATLAHVWDLADLTQDGVLTRDEFAIAMHLINDKLAGRALPNALPPSLLPPAPNAAAPTATSPTTATAPSVPAASSNDAAMPKTEAQRDLFSLLDSDVPPAAAPQPPAVPSRASVSTSTATSPGTPAPAPSLTPMQPQRKATAPTLEDPFESPAVPAPTAEASRSAPPAAPAADLLSGARSELAEASKALDESKAQRASAEAIERQNATTLAELQAQLARARSEHEAEQGALRTVEERVQAQQSEIDLLRQDVIRAESELSALRTQRDELEQKLLQERDAAHATRREIAELESAAVTLREEKDRAEKESQEQAQQQAEARAQLAKAQEAHTFQQNREVPQPSSHRPLNPFDMVFGTESLEAAAPQPSAAEVPAVSKDDDVPITSPKGDRPQSMLGAVVSRVASAGAAIGLTSDKVDVDEDDEDEGPEEPDAMRRAAHLNEPVSKPLDAHAPRAASSVYDGADVTQSAPFDDMPGGFPAVNSRGEVTSAPAERSKVPSVTSVDAAPAPSQTLPSDDFDSAFANMGLANVVHAPAPAPSSALPPNTFDSQFGVPKADAPSAAVPSGAASSAATPSAAAPGIPMYLKTSPMVPRAAQPASYGFEDTFDPTVASASSTRTAASDAAPTSVVDPVATSGLSPTTTGPPSASAPPPGSSAPRSVSSLAAAPTSAPMPVRPPAASNTGPHSSSNAYTAGSAPSERSPTPPMHGDIGPVRQLCQMGFSRTQAVQALERSNYRTERALERLLANNGFA